MKQDELSNRFLKRLTNLVGLVLIIIWLMVVYGITKPNVKVEWQEKITNLIEDNVEP